MIEDRFEIVGLSVWDNLTNEWVGNGEDGDKHIRMLNSHDELVAALKDTREFLYAITPAANCLCHISPPCSDCIEYAGHREQLKMIEGVISKSEQNSLHAPNG
jgi:hypothetical protein